MILGAFFGDARIGEHAVERSHHVVLGHDRQRSQVGETPRVDVDAAEPSGMEPRVLDSMREQPTHRCFLMRIDLFPRPRQSVDALGRGGQQGREMPPDGPGVVHYLLPHEHQGGLAFEVDVRFAAHVERDAVDGAAGERERRCAGVVLGESLARIAAEAQGCPRDRERAELGLDSTLADLLVGVSIGTP